MNERIKEIASQVLDELVPETWVALGYDKIKEIQFRTAELIVEECIRELEISRKCDPYTGNLFDCEYNTCIKEQTTVLKEHFGVEE